MYESVFPEERFCMSGYSKINIATTNPRVLFHFNYFLTPVVKDAGGHFFINKFLEKKGFLKDLSYNKYRKF